MPRLLDFFRKTSPDPLTQIDPRQTPVPDLLREYEALVQDVIAYSGVQGKGVEVTGRHVGRGTGDLPVVAVLLRIVTWDAHASPRVLLGLPLLQKSVQKSIQRSWLAEASHFGGVWLHASSALEIPRSESSVLREVIAR